MKRTDIKLGCGILVAGALVLGGNAAPQLSGAQVDPAAAYQEVACPPRSSGTPSTPPAAGS